MDHADGGALQVVFTVTPPSYSPSPATPSYSNQPREDEERLAISARNGERTHMLTGTFRRSSGKSDGIVLQLGHQDEGASVPSFGRNSVISGMIDIAGPQSVQYVQVELEGQLKLSIAEGGDKNRHLFKVVHTIWQKNVQAETCPRSLEFLVPMPNSYTDGARTRLLPPSYQVIFPGVPGLFANTVYTITVRVMRVRKLLWKKVFVLSTPMKYYPRTRAPRTIVKNNFPFFSLLKIAPEEFCQVLATMRTRNNSGFAPIHCLLFIPSTCIYALSDEIPFHVQLVAPITSLRALTYPPTCSGLSRTSAIAQLQSTLHQQFIPSSLDAAGIVPSGASVRSTSTLTASIRHNFNSISASLGRSQPEAHHPIRVFLLRQIIVEVRGQRAWRTCVLGEGKLTPSPPGHCPPHAYPHLRPAAVRPSAIRRSSSTYSRGTRLHGWTDPIADPIESLDWDGTVRVRDPVEIQTGGFAAGSLVVKDFIVLELEPADPARNPLVALQHAHPIRLVTDSLEENWTS